jgi:hypothetical protein
MVKSASALAIALLAAMGGSARAADCLEQIDNLMVQYDLPASEAFAGTQTATNQPQAPNVPKSGGLPESALSHTPAGRAGAALLTNEGAGPAHQPNVELPSNNQLKPAQRQQIQAALHDARAAEAVNNEAQCLDALHKAQALIGKKG